MSRVDDLRLDEPLSLHDRASKVIPGGSSRGNFYTGAPQVFIRHGSGYSVVDESGDTLIDLNNNYGSLIHGHGHPEVSRQARLAIDDGVAFGAATRFEMQHAEALLARLPRLDQVKYVNTGTEAVMLALRVARGITGRSTIVMVGGSYHGTQEAGLVNWNPAERGVSTSARAEVISVPPGDSAALRLAAASAGSDLAGVLIDPLPSRADATPVDQEFVDAARAVSRDQGALLIIDEVLSFRLGFGGLMERLDVQPDLVTLGKLIGGGFPIGALAGRAEVMQELDARKSDHLYIGGTFSANPLSMRAGRAALQAFDRDEVARLNSYGDELRRDLADAADTVGWRIKGFGSNLKLLPSDSSVDRVDAHWRLWRAAYQRGLLLTSSGLVLLSTPMNESAVAQISRQLASALGAAPADPTAAA